MPLVSVVIPVYNVEKYLRKALDSVTSQTFNDIEIICVDDCSTDNSLNILNEYAIADSRIIVIRQSENKGQGVARSAAINMAAGKYIMFLDPDDWYESDTIEKAYNQISKFNNEMVFFGVYKFFENTGKKKEVVNRLKNFKDFLNKEHVNPSDINTNWITACWVWPQIYLLSFLRENNINFGNERFVEDLPFFVKAIASAKDVSIIKEPLYNYRVAKSKSVVDYSKHWQDVISTKEQAYKIIKSTQSENLMKAYLVYSINSDRHWFKTFSRTDKTIAESFYEKLRERWIKLNKSHDISEIKSDINYLDFKTFLISSNYITFKILKPILKLLISLKIVI